MDVKVGWVIQPPHPLVGKALSFMGDDGKEYLGRIEKVWRDAFHVRTYFGLCPVRRTRVTGLEE